MLGLKAELQTVNLMEGEQLAALVPQARRPRGQVPVLDDEGTVIWDSMAILVYLARKYGGERWPPTDAAGMAEVMQWLAVMENETLYGMGVARLINKPFRVPRRSGAGPGAGAAWAERAGRAASSQRRLAGAGALHRAPTSAATRYVALAPEGDVSLEPYPGVRRWIARIQQQPGHVGMPGL
ncbi:MAG: glutathione S-transferase N-terminal domain-containing protein [Comamonadaceae bacterium]|nr:glutathione S-transferase N-terminal domain-containing protein [Comamonadaceae bacterium]